MTTQNAETRAMHSSDSQVAVTAHEAEQSQPSIDPVTRPGRSVAMQRRRQKFFKVIRRIHLYSGLILWPWVVLYGLTGILFNHPAVRSTTELVEVGATQTPVNLLSDGKGDQIVADLISELNQQSRRGQSPKQEHGVGNIEPIKSSDPVWRGNWIVDVPTESHIYRVAFLADGSRVRVTQRAADRAKSSTNAPTGRRLKTGRTLIKQAGQAAAGVISDYLGHKVDKYKVMRTPRLGLQLQNEAGQWQSDFRIDRGMLASRELNPSSHSWILTSLRLHKAHTYSATSSARWFWAIFVDVMGISMIFWAASGIVMWFQMKGLRRIGACVLIASLLLGIAIFMPMILELH